MKLTVIMVNTHRTAIAIRYENDHMPFTRRVVSVDLTPDQVEMLKPMEVGTWSGKPVYEEIGQSWLEVDTNTPASPAKEL